ncbi:hypothetical protein V8C86DRAFT_1269658 [Haematococcus lacustris]
MHALNRSAYTIFTSLLLLVRCPGVGQHIRQRLLDVATSHLLFSREVDGMGQLQAAQVTNAAIHLLETYGLCVAAGLVKGSRAKHDVRLSCWIFHS